PCSPARAASMRAFKASNFSVRSWARICCTASTISGAKCRGTLLQKKQLPVVVKNAGAAFMDPQRRAITFNDAIVNIPFALGFNTGAHGAVHQANVLRRNYGADGPNIIVDAG